MEAAEARPSLHLSKCQIVGNLMHWLRMSDDISSSSSEMEDYSNSYETSSYRIVSARLTWDEARVRNVKSQYIYVPVNNLSVSLSPWVEPIRTYIRG